MCQRKKNNCKGKKQVADFIIKTDVLFVKKEQIKNFTFAKNNTEKNVKERVLFKNYKERFERSLDRWWKLSLQALK